MESVIFPTIKGFEFKPEGSLLEQVVDFTRPMGIAYERSCEFCKDFHTHDRLMLVFPRGACEMEVRIKTPRQTFKIDSNTFLVVPKNFLHDDESKSSIYDTMALYPGEEELKGAAAELEIDGKDLKEFMGSCKKYISSLWLKQLCMEYFANRVLARKQNQKNLEFFENQILTEVLKISFAKRETSPTAMEKPGSNVAVRAIHYLEANLFAPIELEELAKQCNASVSTLTRHFTKEVGTTPYSYLKNRRLDEAMRLLKEKTYSVSQVALLVGYENFGAFTDAFKQKFKKLPSKV